MSLRSAILAILRIGPLSGYDVQKRFSQSVAHVWHAPDSQIYPELRRMQDDGLVTSSEEHGETGRVRKLYRVTPLGDEAFLDWLAAPMEYQRVRDPAHLRAAYLESTSPEAARSFFEGHLQHWQTELRGWEDELASIERLENPMLRRRLDVTPEHDRARTVAFKVWSYEGLVDRARIEVSWARRCLQRLDGLYADEDRPASGA